MSAKVAVIGAGLLGIRIAGELSLLGCEVHLYDVDPLRLQKVHSEIAVHLQELRDEELMDAEHGLKGEVIVETLLSSAVTDADIVIEAIKEDLPLKNLTFKQIASVGSEKAILCTSTLTLDLQDVFAGVTHPERTLGMRFLFPVYFIDEVEVTPYTSTSEATVTKVHEFLSSLQKTSFFRSPGTLPQKLSASEAIEIQRRVAASRGTAVNQN